MKNENLSILNTLFDKLKDFTKDNLLEVKIYGDGLVKIRFFYGEFSENFILSFVSNKNIYNVEWCGYQYNQFNSIDEVIQYLKQWEE